MGKNVFSQINDMFIQKEVATLFRSSAASKFERKEWVWAREGKWVRKLFFGACWSKKFKPYGLDVLVTPSTHGLQHRNLMGLWKTGIERDLQPKLLLTPWPNGTTLCPNNQNLTVSMFAPWAPHPYYITRRHPTMPGSFQLRTFTYLVVQNNFYECTLIP